MAGAVGGQSSGNNVTGKNVTLVLCLVFAVFFILAGVTNVNDVLVAKFKAVFQLSNFEAGWVQFAFFISYALFSIPAGLLVKRIGFMRGFMLGFLIIATAALLFIPAASSGQYINFLGALFLIGGGITLLQVAMNPLVTTLGPPETSHSRLTFAQMFNSLGAVFVVFFGSRMIFGDEPEIDQSTLSSSELAAFRISETAVIAELYVIIAISMVVIAGLFFMFRKALDSTKVENVKTEGLVELFLNNKRLQFGALCIFLYVGAEVTIGSFLIGYLGQERVMGLTENDAKIYVTLYWSAAFLGRLVGAGLLYIFNPSKVLMSFTIIAIIMIAISSFSSGEVSGYTLTLVGLFNSIMFPTIFSLATEGMKSDKASQASGILATAIVGGALVPLLYGSVADASSLTAALFIPVICYAIIGYYGIYTNKKRAIA